MKQANEEIIKQIQEEEELLTVQLNNYNWQLLHVACHTGNYQLVEWLLQQNSIETLAKTSSGYTPKQLAERKGFDSIVELLSGSDRGI